MCFIIAIHLEGGNEHEHITKVKWQDGPKSNACSRSDMVTWIKEGNKAYVTDGNKTVGVGVVEANPPYLRTFADGVWTNNLLALPRF